jgi:hypothetical protein
MKILQAGVLVLVGALGAMMFLKMKGDSPSQVAQQPPTPVVQTVPETVAPVEPPAAPEKPKTLPKKLVPIRRSEPVHSARVVEPPQTAPAVQQPVPVAPPPPPPVAEAPRQVEAPPPPAPPPPPPPRKVTVAAGTLLPVRLIETISSDKNHPGDTFTASLDEPLVVDGFVIAERGARVEGRIVDTTQAGRVKGLASFGLALTRLTTSDGQNIEISTDSFTKQGPESKGSDAAKIGGAAAIGAAIGAIAGGGKGAAIGAGVGGAAGTGGVMSTRGKPAVLPSETKLSFRLNNSVTITEQRRRRG